MLWSDLEGIGRSFDPWREFERMGRTLSRLNGPSSVEFPAVNVWVSGDHAVITTEIPGIDPKTLDISVVNDSLMLRGSRQAEVLKEGESYHRSERWSGQFTKNLKLPFPVDSGKVEAQFAKGILHISLPRAEADKPRKIWVKSE